jgi:hypothetical protein
MNQTTRIGFALLLLAAAIWLRGSAGGAGGEGGLWVLVVKDGSKPQELTESQGIVANSLRLKEAVDKAGGKYLSQDWRDDFSQLGYWSKMKSAVEKPPAIVVSNGGRITVNRVPESVDAAIGLIK